MEMEQQQMSDFLGLEGMDLSGVDVSRNKVLPIGKHEVTITDASVERDDAKNTARLVLSYSNDDGGIRQWIYVFHGNSPAATEIGKKQLKELLMILGSDGNEAPSVSFFKGKKVGIMVKSEEYNGKTNSKVSYHFAPTGGKAQTSGSSAPLDDEIPF
jgi:hypothetical protein